MSARIKDIHIGIAASLSLHLCLVLFLVVVGARSGSFRWEVVPVNLTVFHDGPDNTRGLQGVKGKEGTGPERNAGSPKKKAARPTGEQSSSSEGMKDNDRSYGPKSVPVVTLRPDGVGLDERDEITDRGSKVMSVVDASKGNGTFRPHSASGATASRGGRLDGSNDSTEGTYLAGELQGGRDFTAIRDAIIKNMRYPEGARKKGLEGRVLLSFVVLEDGSTAQIKVMQSSGFGILDEDARRVVANTRIVGGASCRKTVLLPVMYSLRQGIATH